MATILPRLPGFAVEPLTKERWADFAELFGPRGACGGCWCMLWRMKRADFDRAKGSGAKRRMRRIVSSGKAPGLLAYIKEQPVGWCAFGPRKDFPPLANSRILKPLDNSPVWSIVCLFVKKEYRRKKVSVRLLKAAIAYAKKNGAPIIEGYPSEPKKEVIPDVFAYQGLASAYLQAGFEEVLRRSPTRPIMRFVIK